ncbi:MAG: phosphoglycerate dehydrogenase [Candidatus Omnitrophica bacterium]|nr:phosphoglycerate dehydrogenase [Candidatus Omnitrophota bacterium]MDD5352384.1 phosphoglycerate dehydrogenase [Candidatus Omnitrophota bacterium]MDD5549982.1 phosphoglycerate dehydrogenase [Candidatus Omnitrophota bacterium]
MKNIKKIAITTTEFGVYSNSPLDLLKKNGCRAVLNTYGRKLTAGELIDIAKDAIGLIAGTENITEKELRNMPELKVISRCGTGLDNVDMASAKKLGIKVFNTPDAPTIAVAELTVGLILALLRKISLSDREIRASIWKKKMGELLFSKKVGIVGFGRIGKKVAGLLKTMGAEVYFTDPNIVKKSLDSFTKIGFNELLKKSDIISLHLPYSKTTRKLFGKKEFSQMKKGALIINCSRGGIIDEKALYKALKSGKLGGAAIDVFEYEPYLGPLRELDNVILTPHIGSYAKEARIMMEKEAVLNLVKGLKNV